MTVLDSRFRIVVFICTFTYVVSIDNTYFRDVLQYIKCACTVEPHYYVPSKLNFLMITIKMCGPVETPIALTFFSG